MTMFVIACIFIGFKAFTDVRRAYQYVSFKNVLSALGSTFVFNEWGNQFHDLLQKAGTPDTSYHPTWYSGTFPTYTIAAFPALLTSDLTSATLSSISSSSASRGGGSSGGGGGGGGGGGW